MMHSLSLHFYFLLDVTLRLSPLFFFLNCCLLVPIFYGILELPFLSIRFMFMHVLSLCALYNDVGT